MESVDASTFGLHSCRVGSITNAVSKNASFHQVMLQARHKATSTTASYVLPPEKERAAVSEMLLKDMLLADDSTENMHSEEKIVEGEEKQEENIVGKEILPTCLQEFNEVRVKSESLKVIFAKIKPSEKEKKGNTGSKAMEVLTSVDQRAFF